MQMTSGSLVSRNVKITTFANSEAMPAGVANWLLDVAAATTGNFAICLSGGSTPRQLYEHLAIAPFRNSFPWSRTHFFWGDERFVPHGDSLSNYHMAKEALLTKTPIPERQIHPIPTTGLRPDEAARAYTRELKSYYGEERLDPARPIFDVTFLGLGPDGHTASLFPGTPVLAERERWVAEVVGVKPEPRITLTYPTLESSRHVAFLIQGSDKQEIFKRFCQGDRELPAARVAPAGQLHVFADSAAAGKI
jgi:6-phosphogluconolactonase